MSLPPEAKRALSKTIYDPRERLLGGLLLELAQELDLFRREPLGPALWPRGILDGCDAPFAVAAHLLTQPLGAVADHLGIGVRPPLLSEVSEDAAMAAAPGGGRARYALITW